MEMKYFSSRNCSTVFRIAEESLGIPSLLDPVDMAECDSPDRLSILTYLSEFYHTFKAENSPPVSKKAEIPPGIPEEKLLGSSDLKRKDSCDSGVSVSPLVSPLGSVCNSPPPGKKENPPEPPAAPPVSPPAVHQLPPPPPPPSSLVVKSEPASPVPSPGLDLLLRQRLNISLGSPQSKPPGPASCEKERRSLLSSMISVSGADISRNSRTGQETSVVPPDSRPDRPPADRRRSLDPSLLAERSRVFQPSGESSQPASQPASKFVSCTRISLAPSNPVKYARNNSVSCDVKSGPPSPSSSLRPWRESNSWKNSAPSVPLEGGGKTRSVQVKVSPEPDSHNASFKSKMLKFERLLSPGTSGGSRDDSGMSVSEGRRRANLTGSNQENNPFPSAAVQQRDVRRKSISFPPSFTVSLGSSEETKLTF